MHINRKIIFWEASIGVLGRWMLNLSVAEIVTHLACAVLVTLESTIFPGISLLLVTIVLSLKNQGFECCLCPSFSCFMTKICVLVSFGSMFSVCEAVECLKFCFSHLSLEIFGWWTRDICLVIWFWILLSFRKIPC